jgi:hypothetical protein
MNNKNINNKNLPTLDLSDLYKSIDDPQIKKDLVAYKKLNIEFAKKYQNKLATLTPDEAF